MKMLSTEKAAKRTTLLRLNILAGFISVIVFSILMISGEYATLAERKEADQFYNYMIIGSLLYMVAVWFSCVFSKPFWKPRATK